MPSPPSDVRRVCEFLNSAERPTFIDAMTAQFVGAAGEGAVPIAAGSPLPGGLSLSQLERRLQKKM